MKKLFLLTVCCLILFTGCGKKEEENDWTKNFQASDFSMKNGVMLMANGSIKNISSVDCDNVYVTLSYKSGSLEEESVQTISNGLKAGETKNVEFFVTSDNVINNVNSYTVSVKEVSCYDDLFSK